MPEQANGRTDLFPELAAALVGTKVEVIVTQASSAALAARRVTTAIPIVIAYTADPVGTGLVASLARPGGNVTGVTTLAPALSAKRLEILKRPAQTAGGRQAYHHERDGHRMGMHAVARGPAGGVGSA